MANYGWQKDKIANSSMNDFLKSVILGELESNPVHNDPTIKKNSMSFKEFKHFYQKTLDDFYSEIPELTTASITGYKIKNIRKCQKYVYPSIPVTPEGLMYNTTLFYEFLDDKELLQQFLTLASNKSIFNFQEYDPNNPLCASVRGRCIISNKTDDVYLSYYIHHELRDFTSFAHESAHLIIETLYKNQINKQIDTYLSEFIAYYIQLLSYLFYSIHFKDPEIFYVLLNNHIVDIIGYMWELHIQSLIFNKTLLKPTAKYVNGKLKDEGYDVYINDENIKNFFFDPKTPIKNINAFALALDLFSKTEDNIKYGLKIYKDIIKSDLDSLLSLYSRYNITYHQDNFNTMQKYLAKCYQID